MQVCNPKLINHFLLQIFFPHLPYSEFKIIYIVFQLFPGDIPYTEDSIVLLPNPVSLLLQGLFERTVEKKTLRTRLLKNGIFVQLNFVFPIGGVFGSYTDTKNMFSKKASNCPLCPKHMETPVPILQQTKAHRALSFPNISKQRFPTQRHPPLSD